MLHHRIEERKAIIAFTPVFIKEIKIVGSMTNRKNTVAIDNQV